MLQINRWPFNSQREFNLILQYLENKDLPSIFQACKCNQKLLTNTIFNNFIKEMESTVKDKKKIFEKSLSLVLPRNSLESIFEHFKLSNDEMNILLRNGFHLKNRLYLTKEFELYSAEKLCVKKRIHPICLNLVWPHFNVNFFNKYINNYFIRGSDWREISDFIRIAPSIKVLSLNAKQLTRSSFDVLAKSKKIIDARGCFDSDSLSKKRQEKILLILFIFYLYAVISFFYSEGLSIRAAFKSIIMIPGTFILFISTMELIQCISALRFYHNPNEK